MASQRNYDLENHLRILIHTIATSTNKTTAGVEADFAGQIGMSTKTFQNFYRSKARYDERVIKVLLQNAARCPYLTRMWAERLLRLTGYDRHETCTVLLDALWSADLHRVRTPITVSSNLPPPSYTTFVMRPAVYQLLCDALAARTPVIALVGMGGIGKTSLARELAGRCLQPPVAGSKDGVPSFDLVVWVSDKDQPGRTRLSTVLDLMADVLGVPEATRYSPELKQRHIEQLLRTRRVLLVLDNLESITDNSLIHWLLRLPEPSKALVTTREYRAAFHDRGAWRIELGRMTEQEGRTFITQHSRRIGFSNAPDEMTQHLLLRELGGNPKAIEVVLGLAKRTGRPITQIVQGTSVGSEHELASLMASSWATLSDPERQLVLTLSLFPSSVSDETLAQVAGLDMSQLYDSVQQLSDLALIETEQVADTGEPMFPRRALHPLTRQYAETRMAEDGLFAAAAHARRIAWAIDYANRYGGHRPNDMTALAKLAGEEQALWSIFQWAADTGADREAVVLAQQLEFFYYTRALWGKNRDLYQRGIRAARRLGHATALSDFLALLILLMSRQGQPDMVQDELAELMNIGRREPLQGESYFRAQHAQALAYMASHHLEAAATAWQQILDQQQERHVSAQLITGTLHWLALCRHRQGEYAEAQRLMEQSLEQALATNNRRRAARNQIALARFALDQGQIDRAQKQLDAAVAGDQHPDPEQLAHYLHTLGSLHTAKGETAAAQAALTEALALFERMGMEREVGEIREGMERS